MVNFEKFNKPTNAIALGKDIVFSELGGAVKRFPPGSWTLQTPSTGRVLRSQFQVKLPMSARAAQELFIRSAFSDFAGLDVNFQVEKNSC